MLVIEVLLRRGVAPANLAGPAGGGGGDLDAGQSSGRVGELADPGRVWPAPPAAAAAAAAATAKQWAQLDGPRAGPGHCRKAGAAHELGPAGRANQPTPGRQVVGAARQERRGDYDGPD